MLCWRVSACDWTGSRARHDKRFHSLDFSTVLQNKKDCTKLYSEPTVHTLSLYRISSHGHSPPCIDTLILSYLCFLAHTSPHRILFTYHSHSFIFSCFHSSTLLFCIRAFAHTPHSLPWPMDYPPFLPSFLRVDLRTGRTPHPHRSRRFIASHIIHHLSPHTHTPKSLSRLTPAAIFVVNLSLCTYTHPRFL